MPGTHAAGGAVAGMRRVLAAGHRPAPDAAPSGSGRKLATVRPQPGRAAATLLVAAAVLAGCARQPELVVGVPGPVTPVPSATTATTPAPSTPAASSRSPAPTPSRGPGTAAPTSTAPPVPVLPATYTSLSFSGLDTTVTLPVPVGWTRRATARGYDYGDPTETLLLRVDLTAPNGPTARAGLAAYEPTAAANLTGYRRAAIVDVTGVGDSAVDWSFTFTGVQAMTRRVIDRQIVAGKAGIAVYFSALDRDYTAMLTIWDRAVRNLVIS